MYHCKKSICDFTPVIFLLLLFFTGCSPNVTEPSKIEDLIPLEVGNKWSFNINYFDRAGNIEAIYKDSIEFYADTLIDNKTWVCRKYYGHVLAYQNTTRGVAIRLVSPNTPDDVYIQYNTTFFELVFKYPTVFFSGYLASISDTNYTATVLNTDTLIEVPAGSFKCYQYRINNKNMDYYWTEKFISVNNGWIKDDTYLKEEDGSIWKPNSKELITLKIIGNETH